VVVVALAVVVARLVVVAFAVVGASVAAVVEASVDGGDSALVPEQAAARTRPDARIHSVGRRVRVMAVRVRVIALSAD
jgi:hypothetical protein